MPDSEVPNNITFNQPGIGEIPSFRLPVLPIDQHRLVDPWQIILLDAEDRRIWFTKWDEDFRLEGYASPLEASQFMLHHGIFLGLKKAAELRRTQYNPDTLYIVNSDRTFVAQLIPESSE
jgi:hypothetical protein